MAMVGCDKTVTITFTNVTDKPADLVLERPDGPDRDIYLRPGGQTECKLKVAEDELPAQCAVNLDRKAYPFEIDKKTPDKLWIDVTDEGIQGPRDKYTQIKRKREVETKTPMPVETRTVPIPD